MTFNYRKGGQWNRPTIKRRKGGQWVATSAAAGDMPGSLLFQSPLDSQTEIDRFHIISNSSRISPAADPSGDSRDVTSIYCPEDNVVSAQVLWAPNENLDSGSTGENDPDSVYSRYHFYFPSDGMLYDPTKTSHGAKLPGVAGLYDSGVAKGGTQADGRTWSARMYMRPTVESTSNTQFDLYYYVYHPDLTGDYGKLYKCDGAYDFGKWHQITTYIKMNTPGQNDAILRGWVNGTQVYNNETFRFRDENNPDVGVTRAYAAYTYWGGSWGTPQNQYIYFKDFKLTDAT